MLVIPAKAGIQCLLQLPRTSHQAAWAESQVAGSQLSLGWPARVSGLLCL